MKKLVVMIIGCALLATALLADTAASIRTVGARSCSSWTRDTEDKLSWPAIAYRNWFVGFISGIAVGANKDFLRGQDVMSLLAWMDQYCKENPDKYADEGVYELARKLVAKEPLENLSVKEGSHN